MDVDHDNKQIRSSHGYVYFLNLYPVQQEVKEGIKLLCRVHKSVKTRKEPNMQQCNINVSQEVLKVCERFVIFSLFRDRQ